MRYEAFPVAYAVLGEDYGLRLYHDGDAWCIDLLDPRKEWELLGSRPTIREAVALAVETAECDRDQLPEDADDQVRCAKALLDVAGEIERTLRPWIEWEAEHRVG